VKCDTTATREQHLSCCVALRCIIHNNNNNNFMPHNLWYACAWDWGE